MVPKFILHHPHRQADTHRQGFSGGRGGGDRIISMSLLVDITNFILFSSLVPLSNEGDT